MRIAIFSDVHGNFTALRAVLDHISRQPPFDHIVFAGDLCMFGPRPGECVETIQRSGIVSIAGNTDEWILSPPAGPAEPNEAERQRFEYLAAIAAWTWQEIGKSGLEFINNLTQEFSWEAIPNEEATEALQVVHANPLDLSQIIFPSLPRQLELYGKIRQDDRDLEPLLAGVSCAALAFGHLHIPGERIWGGLRLFNISSVSMPGDQDGRAKYAVLSWDAAVGWSAEYHRVPFDVSEEIKAFTQKRPPGWENYVAKLETTGYFTQSV